MSQQNSKEYGYRLLLKTAPGKSYLIEGNRKTIIFGNRTIEFNLMDSGIAEGKVFIFMEKGFKSELEARKEAQDLKSALLLTGLHQEIGFDLGKDEEQGYVNPILFQSLIDSGNQVFMEVHGVQIFPSDNPTSFVSVGSPHIQTESNFSNFEASLLENFQTRPQFSDKLKTVLSIYHAIQFESTPFIQFILYVTIVEVLAERTRQDESVVSKIGEILTNAGDWNEVQRGAIEKTLLSLKKEISIGKATKNLIKKYRSRPDINNWKRLYDIRSQMLHDGYIDINLSDFKNDLSWLRKLVRELITEALKE